MDFIETKLNGVFVIQLKPFEDERGFYKRLWGSDELVELGLDSDLNNVGVSYNKSRGTFRGMHYQLEPFSETKLVQCIRGTIFDLVLDIREESETFGEWISVELSGDNHKAVFIPKGFAHGFQTLENDSEVLYFISAKYDNDSARGVRWSDKRFGITLPIDVTVINERDENYPDYK